jgi:Leucine-rich repeat (LRR) protein
MKDVIEVEISFVGIGITQITKPLLNSQLSGLVTKLGISKNNISMINANVFDDLRKLKSLEIDDVMNGKLLETKCV